MPIHQRGKGRWRVRLWHKGIHHEWIVRGLKSDAEAFEARKVLELEASEPGAMQRTVLTFSAFCEKRYLPHAELHLRASSLFQQTHYLATLMVHLGPHRLTEIRDQHVEAFARARLKNGLKAISVNNELRVLRRVRNFARDQKVPVGDFRVKLLREEERRPKTWTAEELDRLLSTCAALDDARARVTREQAGRRKLSRHAARFGDEVLCAAEILPLVLFLANTGCRKGEALALQWESVDLERGEIRIEPSEDWRPKSGKPREIPISDALRPWLPAEAKDRRSQKWVFPTPTGERYATFPKRLFREAVGVAKLAGGPHRLRHTFASLFLEKQPDLGLLATILGHSDVSTTRLYAHMLPGRLARARNVVSIGSAGGPGLIAARRAWGAANVKGCDETGAGTGAKIGGVR